MNFSSILQAIREGWDFVWPPCVFLLILVALLRIIAPVTFQDFVRVVRIGSERQRTVVALLRVYGLRRFLPAIDVFAILLVLYVVQQLVPAIGQALPGIVVYDDSAMWIRMNRSANVACALALVPGATLNTLEREIEIKEKSLQSKQGSGAGPEFFYTPGAEKRMDTTLREFNLCKALIAFSIFAWGFELVRRKKAKTAPKRRLAAALAYPLLVLAALVFIAVFLLEKQAYEWQQKDFALLDDAQVIADLEGTSCGKVPENQRDAIYRTLLMEQSLRSDAIPWRVEFIDFYYRWLRTHVLPEKRPRPRANASQEPAHIALLFSIDFSARMQATMADNWHASMPQAPKEDLEHAAKALLASDYLLPAMVGTGEAIPKSSRDQDLPVGSILYSNGSDQPLRFLASPFEVFPHFVYLFPTPSPAQDGLCPRDFHAMAAHLDPSLSIPSDDFSLIWQIRGQPGLIVTEKLTCNPVDQAHSLPFTLGYKVAQIL